MNNWWSLIDWCITDQLYNFFSKDFAGTIRDGEEGNETTFLCNINLAYKELYTIPLTPQIFYESDNKIAIKDSLNEH